MKGPREPGRKDKHNKVQTAKGQRDRRLRLSAHTAIQFYDVQDRLGYDQPSKALDWLIVKAKKAIDKINELPQWQPSTMNTTSDLPVVNQHLEDPKYGFVNANQSLFPGEIFPGIACLNGSGNMYDQNICGLVMNRQEMPQQVVFSQSNLVVDDWNERMPKAAMDQGAVSCSSSDFSSHFELGFGAQARIGEEDDQSEIQH